MSTSYNFNQMVENVVNNIQIASFLFSTLEK